MAIRKLPDTAKIINIVLSGKLWFQENSPMFVPLIVRNKQLSVL